MTTSPKEKRKEELPRPCTFCLYPIFYEGAKFDEKWLVTTATPRRTINRIRRSGIWCKLAFDIMEGTYCVCLSQWTPMPEIIEKEELISRLSREKIDYWYIELE